MGALTSNRKRGDGHLSLNHHPHPYLNSPDSRISKKPRFSSMNQSTDQTAIVSGKNIVSRFARYPASTSQLPREVHAPCRSLKFAPFTRPKTSVSPESRLRTGVVCVEEEEEEQSGDTMGNMLRHYQNAKSLAFGALRYFKKDKEVIDVDDGPEIAVASGDSSIEEVELIEDGREGRSVARDCRLHKFDVTVANLQEDAKIVEHGFQPATSSAISELTDGNLRVDNAGKLFESLSLDLDPDLSSVAVYKRLLSTVEKRTPKLKSLDFEIGFHEKRLSHFRLHPLRKPKEEVPHAPFVPLTKEEEAEIARALSSNRRKVLVTHENSNIEITAELLQCLKPHAWLNDEVINVYLELLKERENREPQKFLKCHFFNTFFYKKLIGGRSGYDYKSVRRWTTQRKLGYGLIECDKIFVPIHKEIHWCLAVINKKDKKFQYLDSLKGRDSEVLEVLAKYFVDEVKDKSGKVIDVSSWEQEYVEDLPEQENGYDCGVFMVKYADFYSRGLSLCFSQEHMPYFRLRTAKEILRLRAD